MKIRSKVFMLFLLTLLVTGVVYIVVLLPMFVADETAMVVGSLSNQVEQTDRVIGKYRTVTEQDLEAIIANFQLKERSILQDEGKLQTLLRHVVSANPQVKSVYLVQSDTKTLWAAQSGEPSVKTNEDNTHLDWYQSAVKSPGKLMFSNLKKENPNDKLIMYVSTAIVLPGEGTPYVLCFEMDAELLEEFLRGINFRDTGIYGAQMEGESMLITPGKPIVIERNEEIEKQVKATETLDGKGVGELVYQGKTYYMATYQSKAMPWTYLFLVDDQGIHQLVMKKVFPLLGVSGFMTLGALLVLLFLVQKLINKPLVNISRMTKYIADTGDLSQTLKVKSRDEIGAMVESFNKMMLELSGNRSNLESIVNERTRELRKMMVAIEQSPSEIIISDKNGKIEYANTQTLAAAGYALSELIDQSHEVLMDPQNDPMIMAEMREALEKNEPWAGDILIARKDGPATWSRVLIAPVFDDRHGITGFISVSSDISVQKEAQEQLLQAKRDAEAATRAKSDFLANMSHEIRTPMNAIIGLNSLLETTELSSRQRDYVAKIGRSADNLLGVINDILDFSKIEAGKFSIESIEFSLDDIVDNISSVIGMKAFQDGLEFVVDRDPELPEWLVGDSLRINQVLLNLAGNAVKFTQDGEIMLAISMTASDADSVDVTFEVRDTGIGMTEEQVSRLFQAFSQADTSTTRKFGGTGLGLAISKDLVSLMGGTLQVESHYGEGSRFWFTLHLLRGSRQGLKEQQVPEEIRGLRIAVVDDNENALEVFRSALADFYQAPLLFRSGRDAVRYFEEHPMVDLFIMDYKMEGLNGVETWLKLVEGMEGDCASRILLVTAYGRDDILREAQQVGIEQILMKPVLKARLLETILQMYSEEKNAIPVTNVQDSLGDNSAIVGAEVLLAEDNEINRQVASEILTNAGVNVTLACDGQEVLDILLQRPEGFDLVLMDLQMPVLDGYQAAEKLREIYTVEQLPILALSADVMEGVKERIRSSGMQGHVSKPIVPKELFEALRKWIKPGYRKGSAPRIRPEEGPQPELSEIASVLTSFDVTAGVERFSGSIKEFGKTLLRFRASNETTVDDFLSSLEEGSLSEARRTIHTLKGVAGNIGAVRLAELAKITEDLILPENPDHEEIKDSVSIQNLRTELQRVSEEILMLEGILRDVPLQEGNVLSATEISTALQELLLLLEDYDTDAESAFQKLQGALDKRGFQAECALLKAAISSYDFDAAARLARSVEMRLSMER